MYIYQKMCIKFNLCIKIYMPLYKICQQGCISYTNSIQTMYRRACYCPPAAPRLCTCRAIGALMQIRSQPPKSAVIVSKNTTRNGAAAVSSRQRLVCHRRSLDPHFAVGRLRALAQSSGKLGIQAKRCGIDIPGL